MAIFSRRTAALFGFFSAVLGLPKWSAGASGPRLATSAGGAVALGPSWTRIALVADGGKEALRQRLTGLGPDMHVQIVLRDLQAAAQPGVVYEVYFGLPPGQVPAGSEPVGVLNFFAVAPPNPGRSISRAYDITGRMRTLLSLGLPDDRIAVTIAAGSGQIFNAAAHPTIGTVELVIQ